MAHGACGSAQISRALVTGIAGPGGGTPDKPVGLAHLHLSAPGPWVQRHARKEDRVGNKRLSANAALVLILRYLEQQVQEAEENQSMAAETADSRSGDEANRQPGAVARLFRPLGMAVAVDAWRVRPMGKSIRAPLPGGVRCTW